jgi:hypothetical protein
MAVTDRAMRGYWVPRSRARRVLAALLAALFILSLLPSASSAGVMTRIAGADRFDTAVQLSEARFDEPPGDLTVYVTSGTSLVDALMAGPLVAGQDTAGMLPVRRDAIPEVVAGELRRLRPASIVVIGGRAVVSDTIAQQLPGPEIALPPFGDMAPPWQHAFSVGYGPDESLLGTADGGEGAMLGPEAGVQAPDGTWWILDGAKLRVARYDAAGRYQDQVVLGPELLRRGIFMPYERPRVLADGTFVAFGMTPNRTEVLRIRGDHGELLTIPGPILVLSDDGTRLYGVDTDLDQTVSIDLASQTVTPVSALLGRDGRPFSVTTGPGQLQFSRPVAAQHGTFPVVADNETGGPVGYSVQVATDQEGTLHLFFMGIPLTAHDEPEDLGGYASIRPDGSLTPVEATRTPFTQANLYMTASNLWVRPGANEVTMLFVNVDGIHVYRRVAPPG